MIPLFHYALRPGGFLFLGTSETIAQLRRRCSRRWTRTHRIFRRRDHPVAAALPLWRSGTGARPAPVVRAAAAARLQAGRAGLRAHGRKRGCWNASRRPMWS